MALPSYPDSVEIAALVVSIFSALVSVGSVVYARRAVRIEEDRRRDEQIPSFTGDIEEMNYGAWHRLHLRLATPWPLEHLTAEIVEGDGIGFTQDQNGVERAPAPIRTAAFGALLQGDRATWRVEVAEERSDQIRIRVACTDRRAARWQVSVPVDAPLGQPQVRFLG